MNKKVLLGFAGVVLAAIIIVVVVLVDNTSGSDEDGLNTGSSNTFTSPTRAPSLSPSLSPTSAPTESPLNEGVISSSSEMYRFGMGVAEVTINVKFVFGTLFSNSRTPIKVFSQPDCVVACARVGLSVEGPPGGRFPVFHIPSITQSWTQHIFDDSVGGGNEITFSIMIQETRTDLVFEGQTIATTFQPRVDVVEYLRKCTSTKITGNMAVDSFTLTLTPIP